MLEMGAVMQGGEARLGPFVSFGNDSKRKKDRLVPIHNENKIEKLLHAFFSL
jgi:hypothetical protein